MKDIVKISSKLENYSIKELVFAGFTHFLAGLAGAAAARAVVLDKLLPFGLSFLAGCSMTYTPAAAIGVFAGYFIPAAGESGFRYIAAVFAVLAIKLLLGGYKRLVENPVFLTLIALLSSALTSAVALKGMEMSLVELMTEAVLCAAGTYFTARSFRTLYRNGAGLSVDELSELLIVLSILLMGLSEVNINGISLGRILGVLLILAAGKYGGITAGAVAGTATALTFTLSGVSGTVGVAFAFAGLISGIFTALSKYAQAVVLIVFAFIGAVSSGNTLLISRTVIEAVLGSSLFLALPRQAGIVLGKLLSHQPRLSVSTGFKKSITMRLELASNALRDVSETVEQVSKELSKINSPDFGTVIFAVEQDACAGCKLRVHCWETKRDETINAVLEMTKAVKQGECSPETAAPEEFRGRCLRASRVGNAAYKRYSDYTSRIAAESRIEEVRSVVSDQFNGISSMLYDLSLDFKNDQQFDNASAENAAAALKNIDIRVDEAGCRIDKFGRMTLEFKLKKTPELVINKLQVMKMVSLVCERDFDIPSVSEVGGEIFIVLNEHAAIKVDIGVEQICASGSSMCGDAYKYFCDGRGHFIMVLSDGMGTGGRAAVDGAMASGLMTRLVKAGFGYDCSLRILNSSMLFKSTDESLATVDIASIDLFTGQTELYKAGAAPTIVRRSGKTGKAESTSLPAGILRDIGFDKATVKCKVGDIVVLMSDGVTGSGTDWIRAEIEGWKDGTAQALAERICECAKRRRSDNHEDDITVMAAILNKAV
ncbi:MAG: SpoIIE family protein phosphatase [Clostridia bacterium]|nr:SpoIIE family protein phosphatase [Clostridia bacterium]